MKAYIFALLRSLTPFSQEPEPETTEQRDERLGVLAEATAPAVAIRPRGWSERMMARAMVTVVKFESQGARYVQLGKCSTGPKGMRCDQGRARTPFQLWRVACPRAWQNEPGSPAELKEAARCAAGLLTSAHNRCWARAATPIQGMFSGYRGASCTWPGAIPRERFFRRLGG